MINFKKIEDKYFVFSDYDTWKYWPFDWIWVKWLFEWKEFTYDTKNLKSWKNIVWILNSEIYLFEEEKWKIKYLSK